MSNIQDIKFKRIMFYPVLPLVYDDALSYIEQLGRVCTKINEVIESMNNLSVDILGQANAYTDAKVAGFQIQVDQIIAEFNRIVAEIEADNDVFKQEVNDKIDELEREVDYFNQALIATTEAINNRTDTAIAQNNESLLAQMRTYLANILVINFITGEEMSVQEMFDFLCKYHLEDALTYTELSAKNCTYNTLINYLMTYQQLISNGGAIIQ